MSTLGVYTLGVYTLGLYTLGLYTLGLYTLGLYIVDFVSVYCRLCFCILSTLFLYIVDFVFFLRRDPRQLNLCVLVCGLVCVYVYIHRDNTFLPRK